MGGVEGVADGEAAGLVAVFAQELRRVVVTVSRSPEMTMEVGAVDGGDGDRVFAAMQERGRCSASVAWTAIMAPPVGRACMSRAAGGDQVAGVGEGEDAGDVGGGEFADGVADEVVGVMP